MLLCLNVQTHIVVITTLSNLYLYFIEVDVKIQGQFWLVWKDQICSVFSKFSVDIDMKLFLIASCLTILK